MTITSPKFLSQLSQPYNQNNFIAVQSGQLAVSNSSSSITFTDLPGTGRVSAIIANSGSTGCYLASGHGSATAVTSSSTPTPASGTGAVATCFYLAAGAIYTLDFVAGTNTLAAITSSSTTTLEISFGYGS